MIHVNNLKTRTTLIISILLLTLPFTGTVAQSYFPPTDITKEDTRAMIRNFMAKPDLETKGERGYVEDILRINAVEMEWDIGMSVHEPVDSTKIPRGADGKKIGIFLLHGGSGDFKSMHRQANLLAKTGIQGHQHELSGAPCLPYSQPGLAGT